MKQERATSESKLNPTFSHTSPCSTCAYKKNTQLKKWDENIFKELIQAENSQRGALYCCHQHNGDICIGWLMMQQKNGYPSAVLNEVLDYYSVSEAYLNSLHCKTEMYESITDMYLSNYNPHI